MITDSAYGMVPILRRLLRVAASLGLFVYIRFEYLTIPGRSRGLDAVSVYVLEQSGPPGDVRTKAFRPPSPLGGQTL